jgi:transposase
MSKNDQFSYAVLEDFRSGSITREQASVLLGCSERAITRRVAKLRTLGMEGIKHGNTRRPPVNKLHTDFKEKVLTLVRSRYYDFNLLHLKEILLEKESIDVSYTTLRRWCQGASLLKHKRKNRTSKVRTYRERMSSEGLLLQMDGSHHAWNNRDKWDQ